MATTTAAPKKRNSPNIAWCRPEYNDLKPRWDLVRDCVAGSIQVKKRGDLYLPRPNAADTSAENKARYEQYLQRAVFYAVTGRTLKGLVGQVMAEDPVFKVPAAIEMLEDDIDGGGVSFCQQVHRTLGLDVAHGRAGLLVDYPRVEAAATQADLKAGKVRPTITLVEPWDIINWRVEQRGGKAVLALVVIAEQYVTDDDGFEQVWDNQWRVLRLGDEDDGADNGLLLVEEWIVDPDNKDEFIIKPLEGTEVAQYRPTDSAGKRLDYVPFTFVGAVNNDPTPDLPPLYDLAELNVAHYRNSADYEEACYIAGQPTPVLAGLTEGWVKDVLKGGVQLGSRSAVPLPEGGTASMLQAEENGMPQEAMAKKEEQMRSLGAKLLQQTDTQMTATQVNSDRAAETCELAMIAHNVSEAYEKALGFALAFVDVSQVPEDGADSDAVEVELNTNFVANRMDAQERAQLVAEWQAGAITDEEMRVNMMRAGIASEEFEAWKTAKDEQALTKPIAAQPSAKGQPPGAPPGNPPAPAKKEGAQ